ncbi:MAG: protein kinase [Peptococcaceae bacterium]|jgi:serine/threonine protein kinase|nr:protein kinase [Peptococcaceae bacterium]
MPDIHQYEPLWEHWLVDELIGEGSYGKVYKVRREEFGKVYYSAVKIISIPQNEADLRQIQGEGLDEASARTYFHAFVMDIVQEIDLMSGFRGNSNIVSFEDHKVAEKADGVGWDILIRMEMLTNLTALVTREPLSRDEAVKMGIHICRALELCATKNIIHRDIKPDNIFISQFGDYKLGDFGIARQVERTMSGLSKKGTYTYMAPEVFAGQEYGASVDTYSLGIVMYRLLNRNRTPFLPDFPAPITPRERDAALTRRMKGEPLPEIPGIDPALNAIVQKACDFDRRTRYVNAAEMRAALETVDGGTRVSEAAPRFTDEFESAPRFTAESSAQSYSDTIPETEPAERTEGVFNRRYPSGGGSADRKKRRRLIAVCAASLAALVCVFIFFIQNSNSDIEESPAQPDVYFNQIVLRIDDPNMVVNGTPAQIDENNGAPLLMGTVAMLPLRGLMDVMGGTVSYDPATQTIRVEWGGNAADLILGSDSAFVNGDPVKLTAAPDSVNGGAMIPAKLISESLGADVEWNGEDRALTITYEGAYIDPSRLRAPVESSTEPATTTPPPSTTAPSAAAPGRTAPRRTETEPAATEPALSVIHVTHVSVNPAACELRVGESYVLQASVSPLNADDRSISWASGNTAVVSVTSSGVITAKAAGSAVVAVTTGDGAHRAICVVTVRDV